MCLPVVAILSKRNRIFSPSFYRDEVYAIVVVMKEVEKLLEDIEFKNDFIELWNEYENGISEEAKYIKQIDKLECIMQAVCYGLDAKYIKGDEKINIPCLLEILEEIKKISKNNEIPLCDRKNVS